MDRNEVVLVGRLPEAVRIRSLQSGSTLGSWRVIVRRQQRGRGTRVDTIPCVSFEPEVTVVVAEWLPDDMVEVVGSLRRRWWGSEGSKSSGYEVEVRSVRRLERRVTTVLTGEEEAPAPTPAPPRPVRSLTHTETGTVTAEEGRAFTAVDPEPSHTAGGNTPASVLRRVEVPSLR
ncbi:single-stranded DNA-binding protein [Streptosporangium canum]|uniref:single-stranded DNA-binding protein n=1 Tax=Streptosporangium canum TaxID=324952 RepID=UPI0036AB961B